MTLLHDPAFRFTTQIDNARTHEVIGSAIPAAIAPVAVPIRSRRAGFDARVGVR